MTKQQDSQSSKELVKVIQEGISNKKGEDVVLLDISKVSSSFCNYFVICHGNSDTQVNAIADEIEDVVRKKLNEKPHHIEGRGNAQWIILDYIDVIVHVFLKDFRSFYDLESLWGDAS